MRKAPDWLADFQGEFSSVLRTPLDTSQGTLRSQLPASWTKLGVVPRSQRLGEAGLSDYHRQYWFRLLTVLQKDFPLAVHLMGVWTFNHWAQIYLLEVPPRGCDLGNVRQHFVSFLEGLRLESQLLQAAHLDALRVDIFMAPAHEIWNWQTQESQDAAVIRLDAASDWRIFREDWPLVELALRMEHKKEVRARPELQKHSEPKAWLIQREESGLRYRPLPLAQARLYELLSEKTLEDALLSLDKEFRTVADLQVAVGIWMSESVRWGLWAVKEKQ